MVVYLTARLRWRTRADGVWRPFIYRCVSVCVLVLLQALESKRLAKESLLRYTHPPRNYDVSQTKLASLRVGSTFVAHPHGCSQGRADRPSHHDTPRPRAALPLACMVPCLLHVLRLRWRVSDATALNAEALTAKVVAMEAKLDEVVGLLKAMAKEK